MEHWIACTYFAVGAMRLELFLCVSAGLDPRRIAEIPWGF